MPERDWSDAALDRLRGEVDDEADAVVAEYFGGVAPASPRHLVGALVAHHVLPPEERSPAVQDFLERPPVLPDWADRRRMDAGRRRFDEWGSHVFTGLYLGALPSAYAAARGVQVLHLTARLQTDTRRRLNETAQFHLDVMAPDALAPGAVGDRSIRRVRLMHAGVRWLVEHDPEVVRTFEDGPLSGTAAIPGIEDPGFNWSTAWGRPINQEDLLGTLLTFTEVIFQVLERSDVPFSDEDANEYLHLWSVIGAGLGIRPDLLPLERDEARVVLAAIRRRHFATSLAGREMVTPLLALAADRLPRFLRRLPATTVRRFVGDDVGDLLGVKRANWTRLLFGPMGRLVRLGWLLRREFPAPFHLGDRLGQALIEQLLEDERGGDRPAFAIPDRLGDGWHPTSRRVSRRRAP